MNIKLSYQEDNSIVVETADGAIHLNIISDNFSVGDDLEIKDLLLNIWSNAKIKDSSLVLEILK